ncbi:MAG TPA: hypothetical protein DIV54_07770, partial [Verrucomicrobiales bacterium]|nr:hypothetical protein [Verrucomicrobiales bacterium]
MADEHPPNPEQKDPRKPSESGGFNWRVLILFAIALGLLTVALAGNGKNKGRPISFVEFKKGLETGKVILGDPRFKLEVVTGEAAFTAQIVGWQRDEGAFDLGPLEAFKIRINLDLDGPKLTRLVGSAVETVGADDPVASGGLAQGVGSYKLADFEEWVSPVRLGGPGVEGAGGPNGYKVSELKLLAIPDTRDAYLIGQRAAKVLKGPEALQEAGKPRKFVVPVNTMAMQDELNMLFNKGVIYRRESNYLKTILLSFLPILILIVLLFLLFRHQMKQAGRGAMSFGKSKAKLLTEK